MAEDRFPSHPPSLSCWTQPGWCETPAKEELPVAPHNLGQPHQAVAAAITLQKDVSYIHV